MSRRRELDPRGIAAMLERQDRAIGAYVDALIAGAMWNAGRYADEAFRLADRLEAIGPTSGGAK